MIYAVDFDGTLSLGEWPECGPANTGLIDFLLRKKEQGDSLILWTCRAGKALDDAVEWCRMHSLDFDAVNDNLPEMIDKYGSNSRKVFCDVYLDDRSMSLEEVC